MGFTMLTVRDQPGGQHPFSGRFPPRRRLVRRNLPAVSKRLPGWTSLLYRFCQWLSIPAVPGRTAENRFLYLTKPGRADYKETRRTPDADGLSFTRTQLLPLTVRAGRTVNGFSSLDVPRSARRSRCAAVSSPPDVPVRGRFLLRRTGPARLLSAVLGEAALFGIHNFP